MDSQTRNILLITITVILLVILTVVILINMGSGLTYFSYLESSERYINIPSALI